MKLSKLEKQMLENIASNEYNDVNGCDPENAEETFGWYYPEYLDEGMTVNQVRGVVTSLVKKRLVGVDLDEEDNTIYLTEQGFKTYKGTV
jgi:hypothetical protein